MYHDLNSPERDRISLQHLRWLFPYFRRYWKRAIVGASGLFLLSILYVPSPYIVKIIVDRAIGNGNLRLLSTLILALVGIQLSRFLISCGTSYSLNRYSLDIMTDIKRDLFERILRFPMRFFDRNQSGYIVSRIGEVEGLGIFFSSTLASVVISVGQFVFCLAILFHLNKSLTFFILIFLALMVIASRFFSKDLKRLSWAQYESSANMTKGVQDSLMGIEAVKSFGAENREVSKFHHSLKILRKVGLRRLILMTLFSESFSLIAACAGFFILWLSGQLIISKKFTLGGYLAFSAYFGQLFAPTQTVANLNMLLQPAKVALLRIREMQLIRQEEPRTVDCATFSLQGGIEFNGVGFGYYPERQILDDIYMDIKPGEKVMIIGANGSGKSTLLKLIMGFYYPQKGLIKFDGIRQEDIPIAALRNRISIVSQNTFLFSDTIRNNILFGAPNASPQEFERIVVETGILDFAMKLPDGIDTEVGERGVRLSGGEKQRISIARALIKKSDIYIFDEAATHLDKLTCPLISNIISLRLKRNTCIVICHQPIDDLKIDRFLYLVDGKIEEEHSSGREDMPAIEESL